MIYERDSAENSGAHARFILLISIGSIAIANIPDGVFRAVLTVILN